MGHCLSCCKTHHTDNDNTGNDREPLLPHAASRIPIYGTDPLPPPRTPFDRIADVVAAFNAGKLPSQDQINRILRRLLLSDILNAQDGRDQSAEEDVLGEAGRKLIAGLREAAQAVVQFGMEKNDDDRVQDLMYQLRLITSTPVHADVAIESIDAQALPSQQEAADDAAALLRSAYVLVHVFATSAAFRLILSDVFLLARETVADVAGCVEHIAVSVEKAAADVENTVRPGGGTVDDVMEKAASAGEQIANNLNGDGTLLKSGGGLRQTLQNESTEEVKQVVIRRLQETMSQAHRQPSYQTALRTILFLLHKYASKLRTAAASSASVKVTPIVWADPPLTRALHDLAPLLSRLASNRPLSRLFSALQSLALDIAAAPADALSDSASPMRDWFGALGDWLDRALAEPAYATSQAGRVRIDVLYDEMRHIVSEAKTDPNSKWVGHLRTLLGEVDGFMEGLRKDRTTQALVHALEGLTLAMADVGATAVQSVPGIARESVESAKRDALKGLVMWLLPRVMRTVRAIPMPRVEFVNDTVEAAVDTLLLTASRGNSNGGETLRVQTALVPDRVKVQTWSEVAIEVDNTPQPSSSKSASSLATLVAGTGHSRNHSAAQSRQIGRTQMTTKTRAHVRIEGMRVAARDVAYYVLYKGARCLGVRLPCTAYEDGGLVSVDVGELGPAGDGVGTGLSVDIELEFDTSASSRRSNNWLAFLSGDPPDDGGQATPLFRVSDVRVQVPGLHVALTQSRHWLLNTLVVQPLAGPVGRAAVAWALSGQIRGTLEAVAELGGRVKAGARARAKDREREDASEDEQAAGAGDWWDALFDEVGMLGKAEEDGDEDTQEEEEGQDGPIVEAHTRATVQGMVHTTVTRSSPDAEPEESVLAVGIGPQLLPGKGGPVGVGSPSSTEDGLEGVAVRAAEEAREAVGDIAQAEESAEANFMEGAKQLAKVREAAEIAQARGDVRMRVERRRTGWKSAAFDL